MLYAKLNARDAELASAAAAFNASLETEVATQRRQFVRQMGLSVELQDAELDALVPKADPRTDAGRAQLVEWRGQKSHLFRGPIEPAAAKLEDVAKQAVGGEKNLGRRLWGGDAFMNMVSDHGRKE